MREKIEKVLEMLSPDFDWNKHWQREKEIIDKSDAACVPSAWPGADNKIRLTDPEGINFFEMVKKIVEHQFDVYPVGDFKV